MHTRSVILWVFGAYPVENEVTNDHKINGRLATEDRKHVCGHALPEVNQEILHLMKK